VKNIFNSSLIVAEYTKAMAKKQRWPPVANYTDLLPTLTQLVREVKRAFKVPKH